MCIVALVILSSSGRVHLTNSQRPFQEQRVFIIIMSSNGYEDIPDVEAPSSTTTTKPPTTAADYENLPEDQGQLMANFDAAAATANLDFDMPALVDQDELVTQGSSMLQSMIQPTVASLCTMATGLLLNYQAHYSSAAALLVLLFPYLNAVIQFGVTMQPIQQRLQKSV